LVASAGRTALRPLATAKDLVTAPGKTVSETWKGVGGWFNRADASMQATDPNREGTVASLTGVAARHAGSSPTISASIPTPPSSL